VSNFRFCTQAPCLPTSSAYLRGPAGPIAGTDNEEAFLVVAPGDTATWTYRDDACDLARCPGHEVRIEDGTPEGTRVGFMPAVAGEATLTWVVPAGAAPDSVIRYFCRLSPSTGTTTGAFRILPISVLTISYPRLG
jgi:hypothetical protein